MGQKEEQLNRLQGKVAVITGGSSGMGFATAEQFTSEGRTYTSLGDERNTLNPAVAKIGKEYRPVQGDVNLWFSAERDAASAKHFFQKALQSPDHP